MAINFCHPAFGTHVESSSVSADGYEPENLLTPGAFGQWKGFLAEHFIKPPLNITFNLPFEIEIYSVVVDPNVGSQHSSGIEIFTATVPVKGGSGSGTAAGRTCQDVSQDGVESCVVSTNIGKGYCNSGPSRLITFMNRRYRSRFKELAPVPSLVQDAPDVLTRDFRCPSPLSVRRVNRVVVRITRVQGGSVPALRKVEIWGQPAPACESDCVRRILEIDQRLRGAGKRRVKKAERQQNGSALSGGKPPQSDKGKASLASKGKYLPQSNECPEEFMDPITCTMMVIPILLPSGHTIDKATLEKHQETEATWGRPPNDPFTGVPFSQTSKPIPNVNLKVRLDKFLLSGGAAFQNVPRTAGGSSGPHGDLSSDAVARASILVKPGQPVSVQRETVVDFQATGNNIEGLGMSQGLMKDEVAGQLSKKRGRVVSGQTSQASHLQSGTASKKSRIHDSSSLQLEKEQTPHINCKGGHEKMVSDSLDDALASTLASLPSYSTPAAAARPGEMPTEDNGQTACVKCRIAVTDVEGSIYSMPCRHLICRRCTAQGAGGIVCQTCKMSYKTGELARVHTR